MKICEVSMNICTKTGITNGFNSSFQLHYAIIMRESL